MGQLTPEMIKRIQEEYAKTPSLTDVAKKLGVTRQTVAKHARKIHVQTESPVILAKAGTEFKEKEKKNSTRFFGLRRKGVSVIDANVKLDLPFKETEEYEMQFQRLMDRGWLAKMHEQDPVKIRRLISIAERILDEGLDKEEAINQIQHIPELNNIRQKLEQENERLEQTRRIDMAERKKNSQLAEENSRLQDANSQLRQNNGLLRVKEIESKSMLKNIENQLMGAERENEEKRQESERLEKANMIARSEHADRMNKLRELDRDDSQISLKIKSLINQSISNKFNQTNLASKFTDTLTLALRNNPSLINFISRLPSNTPGSPVYEFVKSSFEEARKQMFLEEENRVFKEVFGEEAIDKEMLLGTWPLYRPRN